MDQIGRILVPTPTASGLTFPFSSDFGYGTTRPFPIIAHRFGELETKAQQIFQVGIGPRQFQFRRQILSRADRTQLVNFFEAVQGAIQSFTYNAPNANQSTTSYLVIFDLQPMKVQDLIHGCQAGLTFTECPNPSQAPVYVVNSTCLRFPSTALQTALLADVQQVIPLVHIRVREQAVPDIYVSDRRVTVGGQLYLPRLLNIGEPGSDVILTQDLSGKADSVRFVFGNADRVMAQLVNDTDLKYAEIDLSLYHVNSGILLQLWKGYIQSFVSDGTPQFACQCSDGMFQIMQQYPNRTLARTCWKVFKDGINCPYTGSSTSCDYTYDGANGCVVHGMEQYFGGQQVPQQAAIAHSGGNTVTATSIVSDSMWGNGLPDIWCNQGSSPTLAFMVNAIMAVVRDEAQWLDSLGIIGAGPIYAYTIAPGYSGEFVTNADGYTYFLGPNVDGFPAQGWKGNSSGTGGTNVQPSGLRQVLGADPANASDTFGLTGVGGAEPGATYAAGTAFVELRYPKSGSVTPSVPESHTMQVPIAQGLTGWVWNVNGNRTAAPGLTNPFWIAVNTYLRALGLFNANSATQLQYFNLASLVNSNAWTDASGNVYPGTGCAQIADLVVPNILGTGSGTQFQFQGVIGDQKPVRDWLTEILNCGLGYFTFQFGQLSLGCRINASAVDAFSLGNILFQSLKLSPIEAAFERLVLTFADQEYQYQSNTAEYQDKDHAIYYGRTGAPLTARMNSVGCPTLNQGLRLAMTRVREEIGGINTNNSYNNGTNIDPTEWASARVATWGTTILALNTTVGQVVSLTHPEVPGGTANFRIQSWKLKKDWSIEITAKTVAASMYNLDLGPTPADVGALPLPVMPYSAPLGAWAPYQVQAPSNDALFPGEWTFNLSQVYSYDANGVAHATATAVGMLPVNNFISGAGAPGIAAGNITLSATGGSISGGTILRVALCATDGNGHFTPPSQIILVQIPSGTNTNQFTLNGITWPTATGLTGYSLFVSSSDDLICYVQSGTLTSGSGGYTPASITCIGPLPRSTWALPNSNVAKVRLKGKPLIHGGVEGAAVNSLTTTTITANECVDVAGTDNWAGRVIAIIGRNNSSAPYVSFNCTAFNPATGVFTVTENPTAAGVQVGDALVVCTLGVNNSANPYVVTDAGLSNAQDEPTPHTGLLAHDPTLQGTILRVISGTSRGVTAKVVDNLATSLTLDAPIPMDSTSVWILEGPAWIYSTDAGATMTTNPQVPASIPMAIDNAIDASILVGGFTVDDQGNESDEESAPVRMMYVYGAGSAEVYVTNNYAMLPTDGIVKADCTVNSLSNINITLPSVAVVTQWERIIANVGASGTVTLLPAAGETVADGASYVLQPGECRILMPGV